MASLEEAQLAIRAGADALGLAGAMLSEPGVIDDGTIAAIAAARTPADRHIPGDLRSRSQQAYHPRPCCHKNHLL
jgi:hypothetical protein